MIPVSLNGLGIREGGYVFIGASLGAPREIALAASLGFAAIFSITSLYGGYFLLKNKQYMKSESGKKANWGVKLHQAISFSRLFNRVHSSGVKPDYIFMPGCSVTGYNNKIVTKAFDYIRERNNAAIYTGCCGKPSKLAGEDGLYEKYRQKMSSALSAYGCKVVVCCQSCYEVLNECGIEAVFLWEYITANEIPRNSKLQINNAVLKLPCRTKKETAEYITRILRENGCNITEINRKCCRSGDTGINIETAVSCCGECRNILSGAADKSYHLLDILFGSGIAASGKRNLLDIWKSRLSFVLNINKTTRRRGPRHGIKAN
jgi:hypothetical protein